jgi:hypothetical protein
VYVFAHQEKFRIISLMMSSRFGMAKLKQFKASTPTLRDDECVAAALLHANRMGCLSKKCRRYVDAVTHSDPRHCNAVDPVSAY